MTPTKSAFQRNVLLLLMCSHSNRTEGVCNNEENCKLCDVQQPHSGYKIVGKKDEMSLAGLLKTRR